MQALFYDLLKQGYADTASAQLMTDPVTSGAAGRLSYSVPAVIITQTTGVQTQTFSGCDQLHLANHGVNHLAPFQPLGIQKGSLQQMNNQADVNDPLKQKCRS